MRGLKTMAKLAETLPLQGLVHRALQAPDWLYRYHLDRLLDNPVPPNTLNHQFWAAGPNQICDGTSVSH
jgi:hypothetical protein